MPIIAIFFNFIGFVITTALSVIGGMLKFALGFVLVILILLVIVVFGLLHAVAAI
jgi:hypothetical protein